MIKLKDVSKYYYQKGIITSGITKINAEFNIGEFVVITGESGSGKSTLLNVISGLDTYEEGELYINGKETSHYGEEEFENYRKKYISNIFQNFNLVASYTVYQNIELVLLINGHKKEEVKERVLELIKQVDLTRYKNTRVSKLSGGQKQRVAIARALAKNTPIIIADEPTGSLDRKSAVSVIKTLKEVSKDKLVIIVTHNYEDFKDYATRKITMFDGKIIEDKKIKETETSTKLEESHNQKIRLISSIRLGIRNTFNIVPKFLLLLIVFLFMFLALTLETASFKSSKYEETSRGYNSFLANTDTKRIILVKKDKSKITDDDFNKLTNIENIDYLVKDDISLDAVMSLYKDYYYFRGQVKEISKDAKADLGTVPTKDNEVMLELSKDNYNLYDREKLINKSFNYGFDYGMDIDTKKAVLTGIKYNENIGDKIIINVSSKMLYESILNYKLSKSTLNMISEDPNFNCVLRHNNLIPEGSIYLNESLSDEIKEVTLKLNNNYVSTSKTLKANRILNKSNYKKYTGSSYNDYYTFCYINDKTVEDMLTSDIYQSSIFVKDEQKIDDTIKALENAGFNAYAVTKMLNNESSSTVYILNIVNLVVTVIMLIVMFIISYLIIKLILKSRKSYYTILRILGSNKKICKKILRIELFTVLNIAAILTLTFILLGTHKIIDIPLASTLKYLSLKNYITIYVLIVLLAYIISVRFSKYIFKQSAMKTYNEEEE